MSRVRRVSSALLLLSAALLVMIVAAAMWLGPNDARGDEAGAGAAPPVAEEAPDAPFLLPSSALGGAISLGPEISAQLTDEEAAEELPRQNLDREQSLSLISGVFEPELQGAAGPIGDLHPEKYLSNFAAVVPATDLSGSGGVVLGEPHGSEKSVLVESTVPLRTEGTDGSLEPVDLTLESQEGELQPAAPLVEVGIPQTLGEGIQLPEAGVAIEPVDASQAATPSIIDGSVAVYPDVSSETALAVAPDPGGVETMTMLQNAGASDSETTRLSLPAGATLERTPGGGAQVTAEGRPLVVILPPSGIDAAGEDVPVTLAVSGDEITTVAHPTQATMYPVLVDPVYQEYGWRPYNTWAGLSDWVPATNTPSYVAENHVACSSPCPAGLEPGYPGLYLGGRAGPVSPGSQANWTLSVPRMSAELAAHRPAPTSFISSMVVQDLGFWASTDHNPSPDVVFGLWNSTKGAWTQGIGHAGNEGDLNNFATPYTFNFGQEVGTKQALVGLLSGDSHSMTAERQVYLGDALVAFGDYDVPTLGKITSPGWVKPGQAAPIGFEATDTGLGVSALHVTMQSNPVNGWVTRETCTGVPNSPCPRIWASGEAGRPALQYDLGDMQEGINELSINAEDPVGNVSAPAVAQIKVDGKAPEVTLSGALTEQETLGTLKPEYPLTIKATDGMVSEPQSGVAKVEVKVDGKAKQTWTPGCTSENCAYSYPWTLKTSEYTAASHEVEVLVTDAVGNVSENTLEVDLGEAPPQTSFTSPHPSRETTELKTISFKATRGGAPVEGATFRCALDGAAASPCTTPYALPEHFTAGMQTFTVAALDKSGKADPTPAMWRFETDPYPAAPQPAEKLVLPETGKQTASYYTLEAEWGGNPEGKAAEGVTGVTFQMQLPGNKKNEKGESILKNGKPVPNTFETVPSECTIEGQGRQVSWPLPVHTHPGHNAPVYLKVRGCPVFEHAGYPEKEIEFRAVFDGGVHVAGASAPATTEFVSRANANRVATDATEPVGPATVDLLTGAFTMSKTDVSIPVPGYEANLEFGRTYSSTIDRSLPGYSQILGGAWQPTVPLESESEGQAWSRIVKQVVQEHGPVYGDECWTENEEGEEEGTYPCPAPRCNGIETCEEWLEEDAQPHEEWIELLDSEGAAVIFEIAGENNFVAPEYAKELKLTYQAGNLVLAYPNGSRNVFVPGAANEWKPKYVSFQSSPSSMRMVYVEGAFREMKLVREIAPTPEAIKCEEFKSEEEVGCRTLEFEYHPFSIPGHYGFGEEKLVGIWYYGPSGNKTAGKQVAKYQYSLKNTSAWPTYGGTHYEQEEMLGSEYDPRLPNLIEYYAYDEKPGYGNLLSEARPPGQEAWSFEYEYGTLTNYVTPTTASRLKAVRRAGAKTTLAYGVPVHGAGAPYDMSAESIARWGQTDLPVDATAVFPPNHVPAEYPPHEYTGATIHYMDPEGYEVNTASPSPPGVTGSTISTSETDVHGDVVRELSPKARLVALESSIPAARSHELDSHTVYNAAGTEALESWGPLHPVRIQESGEKVEGREHTITRYDEEEPTPQAGTPPAYLPTKETTAVVVTGRTGELEPRVTQTRYEWKHRLPEETIVDPGGLKIRSLTKYSEAGQVIETKQPKGVAAGQEPTAGDTQTIYYRAQAPNEAENECVSSKYANLPCKVLPAAQESGTGRPQLLVKKFLVYNALGEPEKVTENPANAPTEVRTTTTVYDSAGRPISTKIVGGGVELARTEAKTETLYNSTTGAATEQKLVCEKNCTGFDNQATTAEYNSLGQVTAYVDADGAKTETTYDAFGRPATVKDPRGTETMHYDEMSGVLTSLEVSGVGTLTAAYDADGDLIRRGLPNGLTANTTYNVAGEPMKLTYTKESSCGTKGCTWFEETLERSAEGRILAGEGKVLAEPGSQVSNLYKYDAAGRLTEAQETPSSGLCTSRLYTFDEDSNRLTKTTRPSAIKGAACPSSGGNTQSYTYDNADRLIGPTYDPWGRITSLPAEFAGGKAGEKPLETQYFANNMVAYQKQNGVSNTFQLDATGRQRQREQVGGVAGVEVFHYDGPGDSPSWTALGSTWSRNIVGIGGELAAVQQNSGTTTTTFELTDLHGDVVATASSSPTATAPLSESRFSEFGEPQPGNASARFGWLGGKSRRTELQSGVIQMGARSYIPQLGRFLTPDPIPGGSANAYDYANQDPINAFDLGGTCAHARQHSGRACAGQSSGHENHYGKGRNVGGGHKGSQPRKPPLIQSHTITVTGGGCKCFGGLVGAAFNYQARESVSVSAYLTFRGKASETATARGPSGTLLLTPVAYSGAVSTGEILTVCAVAVGDAQSEKKCYDHEIVVENHYG